jgi:hypothetical protein
MPVSTAGSMHPTPSHVCTQVIPVAPQLASAARAIKHATHIQPARLARMTQAEREALVSLGSRTRTLLAPDTAICLLAGRAGAQGH